MEFDMSKSLKMIEMLFSTLSHFTIQNENRKHSPQNNEDRKQKKTHKHLTKIEMKIFREN